MFDARRLMFDTVCVVVLAALLVWGAEAIAGVPITLPSQDPRAAAAGVDCNKPPDKPKETVTAGGLPGLNLAECGDGAQGGTGKRMPKPAPPTEPGKLPH